MRFQIRSATKEDAAVWVRMREALWPEHASAWHATEVDKYFAGLLSMPLEVLIAADDDGRRSVLPSCRSVRTRRAAKPIGWRFSRAGMSRPRPDVTASAARSSRLPNGGPSCQGCTEFASDAVLDNIESASAHAALGFEETVQIRCFRKPIVPTISRPATAAGIEIAEAQSDRRHQDPRRDQTRADDLQRRARRSSQLSGARPYGT